MTLENIMEKLKTALSLALRLSLGVLYYFMLSWKTVQSFIASLLARLFNEDLNLMTSRKEDLMNFSSGTLLVIILLFIVGTF
jgi:predicted PurR-regulated permease PerM